MSGRPWHNFFLKCAAVRRAIAAFARRLPTWPKLTKPSGFCHRFANRGVRWAGMSQDQTGVAVARARQGALNGLYRRHWQELCRYVVRTFGAGPPDPEDVAQAAFTRFAALDDPERIENPRAFLYRTAHNIAINELRRDTTRQRHARALKSAPAEAATDEIDAERVLLARESARSLEAAIRRLPRRKRRLLLLHRVHGLSYAAIARQTGLSQTHVKRLIADALADCRAAMKAAERRNHGSRS